MFLLPLYSVNSPCTIFRSSTLGLLRLSCWFTTVQEIVSITMTIMDTKDYLRGGPDGDRSVSISFTSVGKALASRSHSLHMHANPGLIGAGALGVASSSSVDAAPAPAPAAIPLPTSTPKLQPQASAGSSLSMRDTSTNMTVDPSRSHDLLTLDDVSECDSAALSARQDEAPLTVAVKPTVYGTSAGAFIVQPPLLFDFNVTDLAFPFFLSPPFQMIHRCWWHRSARGGDPSGGREHDLPAGQGNRRGAARHHRGHGARHRGGRLGRRHGAINT